MKRRTFVVIATIALGVVSIPLLRRSKGSKYDHLLEPLLIASILSKGDLDKIGNAYRSRFPDEDNVEKLKARLGKGLKRSQSTVDHLSNMISNDFNSGHTVIIDGWILSITEARQCALYSKVKSNS